MTVSSPGRVKLPVSRADQKTSLADRRRQQSAAGTGDQFCHVMVAGAPYRYTLCGQRLKPPQPQGHKLGKCPNGHPVCPECVRVQQEES